MATRNGLLTWVQIEFEPPPEHPLAFATTSYPVQTPSAVVEINSASGFSGPPKPKSMAPRCVAL